MLDWLTNDPAVAKALRAADRTYDRAISATAHMKLADKIEAIRIARAARTAAYDAVAPATPVGEQPDPRAAAMVSEAAELLEQYGDHALGDL